MQIGATLMTDRPNRFLGNRALSPETLMMGYGYDPFLSERSLKPPVFHTSTFVFRSAQDGKEFFELAYGLRQKRPNEEPGLIYSRINNPDLEMLEDRLAIWDQAEASLVFASGMAAISTTLWAFARPGTVIIHSGPVYGGTDFLLKKILPQFGVTSIGFLSEGAMALGGLGDAEYVRGRMISAHDRFRRCVDVCGRHGFGRIEVANRPMMAFTQWYAGDTRAALADANSAIKAAARVGHRRAEMIGHHAAFLLSACLDGFRSGV